MDIRSVIHPKPEYIFRPSQIVHRLIREYSRANEHEEVMLPWGLPIRVRPREAIGSCIWRLGVYELAVSETVYRLVDPAELAIDVGANIGYVTSIMAVRVGSTGRVFAFEPHPLTFNELHANVKSWAGRRGIGSVRALRMGLSDRQGAGILGEPGKDSGSGEPARASLMPNDAAPASWYEVELCRLPEFIGEREQVGVMKLDVEGHEYNVLKGADVVLLRQGIRDIVFEEFKPYPTDTSTLLERAGYKLFSVGVNFWGLTLRPGSIRGATRSDYIPTYLATSDPNRALRRLEKRGWAVLRPGSRHWIE
jgi:FkbM family methyltransferase